METKHTIKNPIKLSGVKGELVSKEIAEGLLEALKIYLNAGCKEQRRKASIIAKEAIKKATE